MTEVTRAELNKVKKKIDDLIFLLILNKVIGDAPGVINTFAEEEQRKT
jgi:hypothetical protein